MFLRSQPYYLGPYYLYYLGPIWQSWLPSSNMITVVLKVQLISQIVVHAGKPVDLSLL